MKLSYDTIEAQSVEALPELQPAADVYWALDGRPGSDAGPYIFFGDVFDRYVEILLSMAERPGRNRLLSRAFQFIEDMLGCDDSKVSDLAFIETYEGKESWWYGRAYPFIGPVSTRELDEFTPDWRKALLLDCEPDLDREIIDLYGARDVVLRELEDEGCRAADVPGISAPARWKRLETLDAARRYPDAVAFLSCFGTTYPYVIVPVRLFSCEERALLQLAGDLAETDVELREPNQREKAQVAYLPIMPGERVWNMTARGKRNARYDGELWITEQFIRRGLAPDIQAVLTGANSTLKKR